MVSPSFVHLDVRSFFSLKEGAFSPEDLARRAAELSMPAVALTDRDGLYGAARFVRACREHGVRRSSGLAHARRLGGRLRDPARPRRDRLRQPVPARHRRAHGRERGEPSVTAEQVWRARPRARRAPRADLACGRLALGGGSTPRAPRSGRGSTRSATGCTSRSSSASSPPRPTRSARRSAWPSARASVRSRRTRCATWSRGRVPRRRARVHAEDRADQPPQRLEGQRRGLAEACAADALAVRGAPRPRARDARRRRVVRVRPRPRAGALPGLPDARGALRVVRARRALLARSSAGR